MSDEERARLTAVMGKAAYVVLQLEAICTTPAEAAGVLAMAMGMLGHAGETPREVPWADPEFQQHAGRLYEHGRELMRRRRGGS